MTAQGPTSHRWSGTCTSMAMRRMEAGRGLAIKKELSKDMQADDMPKKQEEEDVLFILAVSISEGRTVAHPSTGYLHADESLSHTVGAASDPFTEQLLLLLKKPGRPLRDRDRLTDLSGGGRCRRSGCLRQKQRLPTLSRAIPDRRIPLCLPSFH